MLNRTDETVFMMLVGLPGSGKSTFAEKMKDKFDVHSSDAIRLEMFGDETDQTHNNEVFNELHKRVNESLKNHRSCIYDATNISRKYRKSFLKTIEKFDYVKKIACVFATDIEVCLERNSNRSRVVPEEVIIRNYKKMTLPRIEEGFDCIEFESYSGNKSLDFHIKTMFDLDQDNPHHDLTLDKHCMLAASKIKSDFEKARLATLIHDIGKPVCKTYIKFNGEKDDHAHFYNHAEVGAYIYACSLQSNMFITKDTCEFVHNNNEILTMLLIQYHMDFYGLPKDDCGDIKIKEFCDNVSKLYSKEFANYLLALHKADMCAH